MNGDRPDSARRHRSLALLVLIVGLLVAVVYGQVLLSHAGGRWVAPLRDDLIFFQYARALADGHPYRFFPAAKRTTGSTSHLYVFLLAGLDAVGFSGDRLAAGAFLLNAILWLATLGLVYGMARRLFGELAFAATLLVALTGPVAFAFFACHDMGLATMLFFLAVYGLLAGRAVLAAVALFLLSWARPEGLLVALALIVAAVAAPSGERRPGWFFAGALGVTGTITVVLFNLALTGDARFGSMQGKGVVGHYAFQAVLAEVAGEVAAVIREILLGYSSGPRGLYFLPLIGVPFLLGFAPRCRRGSVESWIGLSAVFVLLMVAASGFSGLQHDKYLAPVLAVIAFYAVAGLPAIERALGAAIGWRALYGLLVVYGLLGTAYFLGDYGRRVSGEHAVRLSAERTRELIPEGLRIGLLDSSGLQFYFPNQEVVNLNGITHRRFEGAWGSPAAQLEILEDYPDARPDVWYLDEAQTGALTEMGFIGPMLCSTPAFWGSDAHGSFYLAHFPGLGAGETPVTSDVVNALSGRSLVDELDLLSPEQERTHAYRRFTRFPGTSLQGHFARLQIGDREILEGGYAIFGDEEFRVACTPGKDLWIVARTGLTLTAASRLSPRHRTQFGVALTPPVRVNVLAGGRPVPLEPDEAVLTRTDPDERVLRIPAQYVTHSPLLLRLAGDHIAFHFWFYQ